MILEVLNGIIYLIRRVFGIIIILQLLHKHTSMYFIHTRDIIPYKESFL